MQTFSSSIATRWTQGRTVSVGLEVDPLRLPPSLKTMTVGEGVLAFYEQLIDATADRALAYKPQSAAFEALGDAGLSILRATVELVRKMAPEVPVILDAKRGDIASTNEKYVESIFEHLAVDAVTVSPFLGQEALQPFLRCKDKGIIVLCKTSNPGAGELQDLNVNGRPLYEHVAALVQCSWNANANCGLVVGGTYPHELAAVRAAAPELPILVPGVGAQGGDVAGTVRAGQMADQFGMIIHASRRVMYAYERDEPGSDFAQSARAELISMEDEIRLAI